MLEQKPGSYVLQLPHHLPPGSGARGWQTVHPLPVEVQHVDGEVIVSEPRLNVYGVGDTLAEAMDDFTSMLVDLYEELAASEYILSNSLCHQLKILRELLAPIRTAQTCQYPNETFNVA